MVRDRGGWMGDCLGSHRLYCNMTQGERILGYSKLASGSDYPFLCEHAVPQVSDAARVMVTRLFVPLTVGGALMAMTAGNSAVSELAPLAVVVMALLSPVAPTVSRPPFLS